MNNIEKEFYNPVLIIGYKDHPVNQFFAEVYVNGQSTNEIIHSYTVEGAMERGLEEYRNAVEQQGRSYIFDKKDFVPELRRQKLIDSSIGDYNIFIE